MNHQPNVNTWKCHNPQWRVLGEFFCRRREKHPILLQNKQNRGCDGSSSHQGEWVLWGPPPHHPPSWRRDGEAEKMLLLLLREVHPSFSLRCFRSTPRCRRVKVITLQLKIKMSLGREPQHNRQAEPRRARGAVSNPAVFICMRTRSPCYI